MSLLHSHSHPLPLSFSSTSSVSVLKKCGANLITSSNTNGLCLELEDTKERIKKMFDQIELSVSSYDTAWVAMVPSPNSPQNPCFPSCLKWLLDNQLSDGSWACHHDPLLTKDNLSSTLACVLALRQWGVGEEQITKGLKFIESNFASVSDENQHMPVGFDIIFSGMIEYAHDLNLNLPLRSTDIDAIFHRRDLELASCHRESSKGKEAYLAYVSEGIGKRQDWEMVMKYQRKNGSLFNSPSTTAAALAHLQNDGCFYYLNELLEKFGNAVPTLYPFHLYPRLCMVEAIESMGIGDHFRKEITNVLDETYRFWLKGEEEIFLDPATCALAFRILRVNGYDVSSAQLTEVAEEHFFNSLGGYLKDVGAALELYRASEMIINPDELVLKKQNSCISHFLKQELSNSSLSPDKLRKHIFPKVKNALEFPHYASLDRLVHRRNIENYAVDNLRMLKTSYRSSSFGNKDFLSLAVEGFNACQSLYHEEIKQLERWVQEKRLDKLKFARQKLAYCYFSAAATIVSPELSDARISWAKNGVLTTVVDDFFDVGGSEDELLNLIQLVEKHDVDFSINNCCSEQVEIIFSALHSTISEIGEKAIEWQGRNVTVYVTEIWLDLLRSMLQEAYWLKNKSVPTVNEYMSNGYVSFALGPIILPALYFVGPHLSEAIVRSPEYNLLYKLVSTCGRLLNDIHSFKRESMEGKLNAVSLHMIHGKSDVTEDVNKEMRRIIEEGRRELLRLVVQEKGSVVPRACKEFFWKMCKVLHLFYIKDDGFTSHDMFDVVNAVIYEPVHRNLHEL